MAKKIVIHACSDCGHCRTYSDRFGDVDVRCNILNKSVDPLNVDSGCPLEEE